MKTTKEVAIGELVVGRIGYQSVLSIDHFPESFWGMELTPPAM